MIDYAIEEIKNCDGFQFICLLFRRYGADNLKGKSELFYSQYSEHYKGIFPEFDKLATEKGMWGDVKIAFKNSITMEDKINFLKELKQIISADK